MHLVRLRATSVPSRILTPIGRFFDKVIRLFISFGFAGVYLFFVISGFCIHLRWAKARVADRSDAIEFIPFWKRRIHRLYPPYLITLAICLMIIIGRGNWRSSAFDWWDLGLHLLMLHNLDPRTAYSVNSVFWTLAVEEQLYLLYFLLLWLRNRWGWGVSLLICFSARLVWFVICMAIFQRTGTAPPIEEMSLSHWFEWALGAVSVEWALGLIELPAYARSATAGASVLCIAAALTYMHRVVDISTPINNAIWAMETPVWGVGCFLILNFLVDRERCWRKVGPPPWSIGLLASVGIFSYSLYLTHLIIVDSYAKSWRDWQQAPGIWQMLSTLVLLPLCCIAFAWLFYQVVERHFLPKGTANRNQLLEKR